MNHRIRLIWILLFPVITHALSQSQNARAPLGNNQESFSLEKLGLGDADDDIDGVIKLDGRQEDPDPRFRIEALKPIHVHLGKRKSSFGGSSLAGSRTKRDEVFEPLEPVSETEVLSRFTPLTTRKKPLDFDQIAADQSSLWERTLVGWPIAWGSVDQSSNNELEPLDMEPDPNYLARFARGMRHTVE